MIVPISAGTATRLEKAAWDNGFDREAPADAGWLSFVSTHAPLRIWLGAVGEELFIVAFSQANVAQSLGQGTTLASPLPVGAVAARTVTGIPDLHRLVRRAFQLSRTLPDELLQKFQQKTEGMPRMTEVERLVVQRVGQDIFRSGLMEYWEGRCAVTGLSISPLLLASHIKPWSQCDTDAERLDVFNGILLGPNLDAAFDRGFITVEDDGAITVSPSLGDGDRRALGLEVPLRVKGLASGHLPYLAWHREHWFEKATVLEQPSDEEA